ncbi:unnamed protein product [Kuraishia capsulata CBS 1993]|uniref:Allantoin permease n=1 Tax=Kuraishia capsulata CBS 1993 TaxID=1382522 RepID=W6MJS1_9ASCO|nr:uncharacterized protein KUCA_T00002204001 [Kuraishia capsulata CBS 1993]CDK26233.1 unnamed protein product [Kuraishia capsulata CBS 1993]
MSFLHRVNEFVKLKGAEGEVTPSQWINKDIVPLPPNRRNWDKWTFAGFWAINNLCISNYTVGSTLISIGNSVWMAMLSNIIGRFIIALMAVFNGYVGADYHIGFPVVSRYIWGMKGSYLAIVQRIMLGVVWLSTQSWTGGLCVSVILSSIFPSFEHMKNTMPENTHMTTKQFVGFVVYCVMMVFMIYMPPERSQRLLTTLNTMLGATLFGMMVYCLWDAHGAGPLLSATAAATTSSEKGWAIVAGIKTVIGTIAVGLTNQPDYNRFAKTSGDQVYGQVFSILFYGNIVPLMGMLTTSATAKIWPSTGGIWNPPLICAQWMADDYNPKSRAGSFFCGVGLLAGQLAINTIDNAFSAGMDISGLFPKYFTLRRGAYLGLVLAICMNPWQLLSTASVFINVMSAYSVLLGAMTGIMCCDYWIIRKRKIKLSDLFNPTPSSIYWFNGGYNWRAFVAWVIGFAPLMPGFVHACNEKIKIPLGAQHLYYLAYIYGFIVSFVIHYGINHFFPPPGLGEVDEYDQFGTFTLDECKKFNIIPHEDMGTLESAAASSSVENEKAMAEIKVNQLS